MFLLVEGSVYVLYCSLTWGLQIGFLTEWQMYAQKLEGESWIGEKMDVGKIEKMSGKLYGGDRNRSGLTALQINSWDRCMSSCKRYGRETWTKMTQRINELCIQTLSAWKTKELDDRSSPEMRPWTLPASHNELEKSSAAFDGVLMIHDTYYKGRIYG